MGCGRRLRTAGRRGDSQVVAGFRCPRGYSRVAALADRRKTASMIADHRDYSHQSGPLSETVRQSLLDDLTLSDRDRAA